MPQVFTILFAFLLSLLLHLAILQYSFEVGQAGTPRYLSTEIGLVQISTPPMTAPATVGKAPLLTPALEKHAPVTSSPVESRVRDVKPEENHKKTTVSLEAGLGENDLPRPSSDGFDNEKSSEVTTVVSKDAESKDDGAQKQDAETLSLGVVQPGQPVRMPASSESSKSNYEAEVRSTKAEKGTQLTSLPPLSSSNIVQTASPRYDINPAPVYPDIALRKGWEGKVLLQVDVKKNGSVEQVRVVESSGFSALDRAAIKAVRRWQFFPSMTGGLPVDGGAIVPINFDLP